jgi:hypothetical protein
VFDVAVERGDVFYGAFEDNKRRMQSRVRKVLGDFRDWPADFEVRHKMPIFDSALPQIFERTR